MAAAAAANLSALKAAVASGDVAKATTLLGGLKARVLGGHGTRVVARALMRVRSGAAIRSRLHCQQVALTAFASLPPLLEPSPTAAAELALARTRLVAGARSPKAAPHAHPCRAPGDVFEQAVLLSVKARDDAAFERNFAQLKPYYTDARCV